MGDVCERVLLGPARHILLKVNGRRVLDLTVLKGSLRLRRSVDANAAAVISFFAAVDPHCHANDRDDGSEERKGLARYIQAQADRDIVDCVEGRGSRTGSRGAEPEIQGCIWDAMQPAPRASASKQLKA